MQGAGRGVPQGERPEKAPRSDDGPMRKEAEVNAPEAVPNVVEERQAGGGAEANEMSRGAGNGAEGS